MQDPNNNNLKEEDNILYYKPKGSNKKINLVWLILGFLVAFYVGVAWGKKLSADIETAPVKVDSFIKNLSNPKELFLNTETNKPSKVDFDIFWQAWKKIDQKYIDESKLDAQKRVYGAIEGMIGAMGDPYSGFMDPQETNSFNTDLEGTFEGIGAELGVKEEVLTVIAPIEGAPAAKAGIKPGDKIIKINGEMTNGVNIDEAVKKIRGPKGTDVTLTIFREGETSTQDLAIIRDKIEVRSIIYEKKENGVAYIRITKFAEDTAKEFSRAVSQIIADGSRGLIVDVRSNPGGFLDASVEIASEFVPKGEVVVRERQRDGKEIIYKAQGGESLSGVPVVVLINEGSASAAEILAGALRDDRQALLIGMKSYGKGSVQQLEKMPDGSSLRITIAKWFTPSNQSIHEKGLTPDIEVKPSAEDIKSNNDIQLKRALEEIKAKINKGKISISK